VIADDQVLLHVSQVISQIVRPRVDFVGHVGGDDFVFLLRSQDWTLRLIAITEELAASLVNFHSHEHREAGGHVGVDREGSTRHFPLLSASIAAFEVDGSRLVTPELIAENLRQLTGYRFRVLLTRATNHPVRAGLLGVAAGVVLQSSSAVAFVLSGMIASGLVPLRRALVVLACANIGTAALVFVAAVDLHLPILFLIGVSGLFLAFKVFASSKPGVGGLLSIGKSKAKVYVEADTKTTFGLLWWDKFGRFPG